MQAFESDKLCARVFFWTFNHLSNSEIILKIGSDFAKLLPEFNATRFETPNKRHDTVICCAMYTYAFGVFANIYTRAFVSYQQRRFCSIVLCLYTFLSLPVLVRCVVIQQLAAAAAGWIVNFLGRSVVKVQWVAGEHRTLTVTVSLYFRAFPHFKFPKHAPERLCPWKPHIISLLCIKL